MAVIWDFLAQCRILGLSDSENNTITIAKIVVFTIVNTITIVGYHFFNTLIINKKGINLSSITYDLVINQVHTHCSGDTAHVVIDGSIPS